MRYPKARFDFWRVGTRAAWWRDVWQGAQDRAWDEDNWSDASARRYHRILRHERAATDRIYSSINARPGRP